MALTINDRQYDIEICLACGETVIGSCECKCGGTVVVFGSKFKLIKDKGIICDCGNSELIMVMHMNMANCHMYNYKCPKCFNLIGIQSKKREDDDY